ncbi:universal stress protein [Natrialba sp. INN-245]|uniref:universal stress protein n=1 Tax=Natrialba sp. INN-245 TaxID=2690967 RepID=UPI0013136324|nr:universal stress protein [Natrialba sp. INN-245]
MCVDVEHARMFATLLVPTDGSDGSDAAIAHAIEYGQTYGAKIRALYVVETGLEPSDLTDDQRDALEAPSEGRGREATIEVTNRAESAGLEAAREVREGVPYREILSAAVESGDDLIVMGTHGRRGVDRARLGSTTERVLALADVPVLSVRLDEDASPAVDDDYDRIVVPTDGSDAAERAAETAFDVAERYDATVYTVYVLDTTIYDLEDAPRSTIGPLREGGENAIQSVASMAEDRGLETKTAVQRGVPADELLAYASSVDADLLAMGTRGQAVGTGDLLGSTTARVVRRSPVPVLSVG